MTDTTYTIGQITQEFGLTHRAVRFYEERGLLTPARSDNKRGKSWDRHFSDQDRHTLAGIVELKKLGFTLSEIIAIISEGHGEVILSDAALDAQIGHLEKMQSEIEAALSAARAVLRQKAAAE